LQTKLTESLQLINIFTEDKTMSEQPTVEQIMKQAQQIQDGLQKAQAELEKTNVVGESGGGFVKVTLSGRFACKKIEFDDSLMKESKSVLQDLVAGAINDAVAKVEKINQDSVAGMMSSGAGSGQVNVSDTIKPRLS